MRTFSQFARSAKKMTSSSNNSRYILNIFQHRYHRRIFNFNPNTTRKTHHDLDNLRNAAKMKECAMEQLLGWRGRERRKLLERH